MKTSGYLIFCLLLLSACGPVKEAINPYEETFRCRAKDETGKCIDTPSAYKEARFPGENGATPPPREKLTAQGDRYKVLSDLLDDPEKPLLEPPKVMRVLLLPYKGEKDELFMTRFVYLKLQDSQWILTDMQEPKK